MSPKLGTFEGLELLREKIQALRFVALQGPQVAYFDLQNNLPSWTGALKRAVELIQGDNSARVQLTGEALADAQPPGYEGREMQMLGLGPIGPYAIRIEILGRPGPTKGDRPEGVSTGGDGMMAWFDAREMVKQLIKELGEQW